MNASNRGLRYRRRTCSCFSHFLIVSCSFSSSRAGRTRLGQTVSHASPAASLAAHDNALTNSTLATPAMTGLRRSCLSRSISASTLPRPGACSISIVAVTVHLTLPLAKVALQNYRVEALERRYSCRLYRRNVRLAGRAIGPSGQPRTYGRN